MMGQVLQPDGAPIEAPIGDAPLRVEQEGYGDPRLLERRRAWLRRPLTRALYQGYYRAIAAKRSRVAGIDVEIGSGHGGYAEYVPGTLATDIGCCPWLDCVADAFHMPFQDGEVANLILIDVVHHLADPLAFFAEVQRVLCDGGRIILVEPYVSPISWIAWRFFHEEEIHCGVNPFTSLAPARPGARDDPWDANIALPTLLFFRQVKAFRERFRRLHLIHRGRFDMLVMPLSGGFARRRLITHWMVPILRRIERMAAPLAPLLSFRCMVVLEKRREMGEL